MMTRVGCRPPRAPRGEKPLSDREHKNEVKPLKPDRPIAQLSSEDQHTFAVIGPW